MKSILVVSNSIEYLDFDIRRDVETVSFCEMVPMAVAPVIKTRDSEPVECDVVEAMEYCFKESYPSAISIGYLNSVDDVYKVMDELDEHPSVPCVLTPRLITDDGDLMVSEEVYNELMTKILPRVKLVVINKLEAELIAGFGCFDAPALKRAMKKIFNFSGCSVLIKPSDVCADFSMFDGRHFFEIGAMQLNVRSLEINSTKYNLGTACACALGSGANMHDTVCAGIEVYISGSDVGEQARIEAQKKAEAAKEAARIAEAKAKEEALAMEAKSTSLVSPVKSLRDRARSLEEKYSLNISLKAEASDKQRSVVLDLMEAAANEKEKQEIKEKELENKKADALETLRGLSERLGSM